MTGDRSGECGFYAVGIEKYTLKDIKLKNITLRKCKIPYILKPAEQIKFENVILGGIKMPENPKETEKTQLNSY